MRARKVFFIAGFLVTWTYVTYYFLLRNANGNNELSTLTRTHHTAAQPSKLEELESGAQEEFIKSERLTAKLLAIFKSKYDTTIDEETHQIDSPKEQQQVENPQQQQRPIDIIALSPDHPLGLPQPPEATEVAPTKNAFETHTIVPRLPNGQPIIPILLFACNRVSIRNCLDNLLLYRPNAEQFPIIVSQDCGDVATKNVILSYGSQLTLIEQPDQSDITVPKKESKFKGYYKIARHYGWALNTTFQHGYDFVVIVEDDLNVAPDFYEYFLGTHALLKQDPSLWCVSAWNDNGKGNLVDKSKPELLYRTDFFPGLGWMLTKELWQELSVKWPKSFWDDWIRHPEQRKDRVCIRPEISRTRTFGKVGVSNGLFFEKYLKHIELSTQFVQFTKMNLTYLLKDNYDRTFLKLVYTYPIVTYDELRRNLIKTEGPVRIQYTTREQYKRITKMLGLMDDFKSGVPRTAYHGIVAFMYLGRRVYLAPNVNWKGYDLSWS